MTTHVEAREMISPKEDSIDPLDVSFKPRVPAELTLEAPQRSSIHEAARPDSADLRESDSSDD